MTENNHRSFRPRAAAQEVLSPAEKRFESWRHTIGLFLGPLAAVLLLYAAPLTSLTPVAHRLAAVLGWVVTWWVTEPVPIPITALVGALLCVMLGIAPAKAVFAPFADPIIFLFLGSFILAEAMTAHGLDRRLAFKILSLRWVGNSTGRILFAYGAITAGLSAWISNTAAVAMMFPIGLGIIYAMADMMQKQKGGDQHPARLRYATGMMLMAAYASSVGGIATPVGTPPNLIGIGMIEKLVKVKIPFFQWMLFAIPIMITVFAVLYFILYWLYKPEVASIEGSRAFVQGELQQLGAWSRGEKNALIAFLVTVALWVAPGFLAVFCGTGAPLFKSYNGIMPEAAAAIVGVILLFVLPVNWGKRQFTITWKQASSIDWGTLLLFGGGLTLGNLMFETKLAEAIGTGILEMSGTASLWGITFAAIVMAAVITEVTSNTASANMVVPVVISLALAAGVNPLPPAIGASLGASLAFMLPVSTPPNAIVYGSGMVPITKMIRAGIFFDLLSIIIIWTGLRIMLPLVGLG